MGLSKHFFKMSYVGMNIAIAENTHEMKRGITFVNARNNIFPSISVEDFASRNIVFDGGRTLEDNLSSSHSIMTNFGIAHIVFWHADILTGSTKFGGRVFFH